MAEVHTGIDQVFDRERHERRPLISRDSSGPRPAGDVPAAALLGMLWISKNAES
jgi:hypothetical protein